MSSKTINPDYIAKNKHQGDRNPGNPFTFVGFAPGGRLPGRPYCQAGIEIKNNYERY